MDRLSNDCIPVIFQLDYKKSEEWLLVPLVANRAIFKFHSQLNLNKVEQAILDLITDGKSNINVLSETMKLDKEIILFEVSKLTKKGILDDTGALRIKSQYKAKNYEPKMGYYFYDSINLITFDRFILNEQIKFQGMVKKNPSQDKYTLKLQIKSEELQIDATMAKEKIAYKNSKAAMIENHDDRINNIEKFLVYALTYVEGENVLNPIEKRYSLTDDVLK